MGRPRLKIFHSRKDPAPKFLENEDEEAISLAALREIRKLDHSSQIVMRTAHGTTSLAVEAMREGAVDFLKKSLDPDPLSILDETGEKPEATRLLGSA